MTKLRLIKPWGLRTVRQHLNVINEDRANTMVIQRCTGPIAATEDVACRFVPHEIRSARHAGGRAQHRVIAPVVCLQLRYATLCIR